MERVSSLFGSYRRVSCTTLPPSSIRSIWRWISLLIARSMKRNELTFLISQRVPNSVWPFGRIDTLQSQRSEPSAMLPSQMPR
ncbi:hypothetical protein D3C76_1688870 [compost metagenome]